MKKTKQQLADEVERLRRRVDELEGTIAEVRRASERSRRLSVFPRLNPNPVMEVDRSGRVTFMNPAAEECFPDLRELGFSHPVLRDLESIFEGRQTIEARTFSRELDLENAVYAQKMALAPDADTICVFSQDVTERRRAEDALRESQQLLKQIADSVPALIAYVDTDERYKFVNRSYAQWIGRAPQEIRGKRVEEVIGAERYEIAGPNIRKALSGAAVSFDSTVPSASGPPGHLYVAYIPDLDRRGNVVGISVMIRDVTEQKRAEAALRESEARAARAQQQLLDAIESIAASFILYDADERLVLCNGKAHEFLPEVTDLLVPGTSFEDLVRGRVDQAVPAEAAGRVEAWVNERIERFRNPGRALEEHHADGRWTHTIERRTSDGGTVCVRTDISDLKRREEELAEKSALLQATFDNIDQGISLVDADLNIAAFNRRFLELLDIPPGRIRQGDPYEAIIRFNAERGEHGPGDVEEIVRERLESAKRLEESRFERTLANGVTIETWRKPVPGGGIVATYTDVTERKQREAALHESALHIRAILDNVADSVVTIDETGVIASVNPATERLFGYSAEELVGRNVSILMAEPDRSRHDGYIGKYLRTGEGKILGVGAREVAGRRKDGSSLWVELAIREVKLGGKQVFIGSMRDATERKWAEEALRTAKTQADLASRAKSEFLANMSHELRTPLNAVIGFSEMIEQQVFGPVGSPKYAEYARDIKDSGKHLLQLINDILDISKIEAGKLELHEERIDVARVVRSCLTLVRERAERGGVILASAVAPDIPALRADERKLKQVLLNLLSNAVKFTPAGGTVTVEAEVDTRHGLVVRVIDTGIGIAPEDIPKAMSAFGQVDGALNRKYEGTGLGLPLTRALVELHGGKLELDSEVGAGTTVTVRFPAERTLAEDEKQRQRKLA